MKLSFTCRGRFLKLRTFVCRSTNLTFSHRGVSSMCNKYSCSLSYGITDKVSETAYHISWGQLCLKRALIVENYMVWGAELMIIITRTTRKGKCMQMFIDVN
jgi:hypothetical protein